MAGLSKCSLLDQRKYILIPSQDSKRLPAVLLHQELMTSTRPPVVESNMTFSWLSLWGKCLHLLLGKQGCILPQQTLGTGWNKCSSNSSHSLVGASWLIFTLEISRQGLDTSPMCPLIELIAQVLPASRRPAEGPSCLQEYHTLFSGGVGLSSYLLLSTNISCIASSQIP